MTKAVTVLALLVLLLSALLGASIKSGFEKSDKIEQLQQSIKAVNNAQKIIYKIREVTKDEDCYYKELPEAALKELRK